MLSHETFTFGNAAVITGAWNYLYRQAQVFYAQQTFRHLALTAFCTRMPDAIYFKQAI